MLFESKATRENRKRALALHGMTIRYVTERLGQEELVLGRSGVVSVRAGELIVSSSRKTIFRASLKGLRVSYLMSGDGAILAGRDTESGRDAREITIHFVDYIK